MKLYLHAGKYILAEIAGKSKWRHILGGKNGGKLTICHTALLFRMHDSILLVGFGQVYC